ncbi:uncharacterized protein LOC133098115 [Eubalaena glacialis]|uniref:uncharacterized protein LOC133098115 n=1 Tax=Eubalaena glacialis TaxID=27606 RepID=UPI002A5A5C31|nr:uncharacterized protein LOC133098115 [Eubalaena glacialis]
MASRLLRGAGALAAQALSARGPRGVSVVRPMASGGGVPTDAERATGLQREVMLAARKGLDPYHTLAPKAASGTKEDPNLVRFITRKQMVGCICEEDSSAVIWLWLHKGEAQRGPSCGTHYKLVPYQLAHGAPALAPSKWDLCPEAPMGRPSSGSPSPHGEGSPHHSLAGHTEAASLESLAGKTVSNESQGSGWSGEVRGPERIKGILSHVLSRTSLGAIQVEAMRFPQRCVGEETRPRLATGEPTEDVSCCSPGKHAGTVAALRPLSV